VPPGWEVLLKKKLKKGDRARKVLAGRVFGEQDGGGRPVRARAGAGQGRKAVYQRGQGNPEGRS